MDNTSFLILLVSGVSAVLTFIFGLWLFRRAKRISQTWLPISARIEEVEDASTAQKNMTLVRYVYMLGGQDFRGTATIGKPIQQFTVGEHIDVLYEPEHFENNKCAQTNSTKVGKTLMTVSAFEALMGVGIYYFLKTYS